jgi:hypothetical protein
MSNKNFNIAFAVDQSASEVFNAVTNVSKWWTENVNGNPLTLNDEFTVQFEDMHFSKQRLIEVVPNKKAVWLVTDSKLSWLKNKQEWTGTKIVFEINILDNRTQLQFTHIGLNPDVECYHDCSNAWSQYIRSSLFDLITTGKGSPEQKQIINHKS